MKRLLSTVTFSAAIFFSHFASANLIDNGSFESPQIAAGTWRVFNSIDGWDTISGAGIEIQNNALVTAQHGNQYVELDSHNNSAMTQEISGLNVGSSYDLSLWYRARTNNGGNDNGILVHWDEQIMGDVALDISNVLRNDGGWTEYTKRLIASAETMFLSFGAIGLNNSLGGFIDNVRLTAVPAPSALVLFGLGILGLVASRKRVR